MLVKIPPAFVKQLQTLRPNTHEIGGKFEVDQNGIVTNIITVEGEKCRDEHGVLLKDKICQVVHPKGKIVFHTHPRANRPSSQDLRLALMQDHLINIVVTPLGIWGYAPSPSLRQAYDIMSNDQKRCQIKEYRFLGHMQQKNTQQGNCEEMLRWMRKAGFFVHYFPYDHHNVEFRF